MALANKFGRDITISEFYASRNVWQITVGQRLLL